MWGQTTWCRFKTSQWHLKIEPNYCVKHLIVFKKSKFERTFWNNWYEKHSKWLYHKNIRKCKIQNEIITSINNLKVPNTLMLSLQQKVSKSVNNSNLKCVERFVTHPTVNCAASLKRRSIFLTTVILLSVMIGSNGITTWFSKPFCCLTRTNKCDVFIEGYRSYAVLFNKSIPDIFVIKDKVLYVIELIVCFEANFSKSWNYKITRYKNLSHAVVGNYAMRTLLLEKCSLGFYLNDTQPFIKFLRELKIDNTEQMLRKCSKVTIRASFYLYICKNKEWLGPKLLAFI